MLVAVANQLKQHRSLQLAAAHVDDVIDNQQAVSIELLNHGRQFIARFCLLQQLHQSRGKEEASGLDLLDHCHRDGNGQVGFANAAGAKQQQVLRLQEPGVAAGKHLQLLPVLRFEMLVIEAIKPLLPRKKGIPQQPMASDDQAVVDLLLAQGVEKLTRAPTLGLSLLGERLAGACCESGRVSAV